MKNLPFELIQTQKSQKTKTKKTKTKKTKTQKRIVKDNQKGGNLFEIINNMKKNVKNKSRNYENNILIPASKT